MINKAGDIIIVKKILERGWNLSDSDGFNWIFERDGRKIKVRIKTFLGKSVEFDFKDNDFDYLILTNLQESYIIPRLVYWEGGSLLKTFKLLREQWQLIDFFDYFLVNETNDCKIAYSQMEGAILSKIVKNMDEHPYYSKMMKNSGVTPQS